MLSMIPFILVMQHLTIDSPLQDTVGLLGTQYYQQIIHSMADLSQPMIEVMMTTVVTVLVLDKVPGGIGDVQIPT